MPSVVVVPIILMDDARELLHDWGYADWSTVEAYAVDMIINREYDGGISAFINDFS
jgi:hypothetical protein